ncbi:type 1 glutamine amidotransferase [Streptomyces sp. NPDC003077]|uniref:type 1 glutamine amidotransferase n=1 Tax=Streptomyces sp. NPDC003077 TaxID=3154443 RepID=UPI0033BBA6D7
MRTHFVIHETFEGPGAYEEWAAERGHQVTSTRLYAGEALPETVEGIDLLIVMGGPQSPATTQEECPHFDAAAEKALIGACAEAGKAVIGVCLGAQLLGEALGAPVEHSPEKEIGSFPITLTEDGLRHGLFADFGRTLEVGHWHGDMPGLTENATVLATSEGCPRQIVAYGRFLYGFQCHLEFNHRLVGALIEHSAQELATLTDHRFVQQPEELRRNSYEAMNATLRTFLDRLQADYLGA